VLAALYVRGAPRSFDVKRGAWPSVERCLRVRAPGPEQIVEALREDGFWAEALALETPGLMEWAEESVQAGKICTAFDCAYPRRWLENIGSAVPPAFWHSGSLPVGPYLSIVGSRKVSARVLRFAHECGEQAVRLGYTVVSGGAAGCDTAAARGAVVASTLLGQPPQILEIVPFGLGCLRRKSYLPQLSVCAPDEEFSTGAAMERNALLYGIADASIIVHARFKMGGTWHGATQALRTKIARLIVRDDPTNEAHRALIALGARPIRNPSDIEEAVRAEPLEPRLIG
jgi:predicted Rossmann fold nucleotide-binding protein DprA/Smf involved in DNA uptake